VYCPISFNLHITCHSPCQFVQNVTLVLCHIVLVWNCLPSWKSVFFWLILLFLLSLSLSYMSKMSALQWNPRKPRKGCKGARNRHVLSPQTLIWHLVVWWPAGQWMCHNVQTVTMHVVVTVHKFRWDSPPSLTWEPRGDVTISDMATTFRLLFANNIAHPWSVPHVTVESLWLKPVETGWTWKIMFCSEIGTGML